MEADLFLYSTISEYSMGCMLLLKLRVSENTPDKFRPLSHLQTSQPSLSLSLLYSYPYHKLELAWWELGTGI